MGATYQLSQDHLEVLRWFEKNAGQVFRQCPSDVGLQLRVALPRRGIWKPSALPYAISVVQSPKGLYEDQDPIINDSEGTWEYYYHQEGHSEEEIRNPQAIYTNAALFRCWADGVPVGVIIPAPSGDGYEVLGLALIDRFDQGYFRLVGPATVGARPESDGEDAPASLTASLIEYAFGEFDPQADQDNRLKVIANVYRRQGTPRFRRALLSAYERKCAMTLYDAEPALEAAHILPYRGPQTNHPHNGLLLRADMHDLFDLGLVAVETSTMRIRLASQLAGTLYEQYEGARLWMPRDPSLRPSIEALDRHRQSSAVA